MVKPKEACQATSSEMRAARSRPTAYVLGGNLPGLAVIRSLGRAGIPVISVGSSEVWGAVRSRYVRGGLRFPDPADRPLDYVERLLGLEGGVVIPTSDESLEAVSAHRDELARVHLVACPSHEAARLFLDKERTSEMAERCGVEAPRTASPQSEEQLDALLRTLSFPVLVKPRASFRYSRAFGVKMHRVEDRAQLWDRWRQSRALGIETMIQELIPGPETGGVNYNVYMVEGEPLVEFTSRKVRLAPRDFGFPSVVVSGRVPEVLEPGRKIVRAMGIEGFANVEFKKDERDGRYKLMEVNGRPNRSGALAVRCGVDFPVMSYHHLVSGCRPRPGAWAEGVYWVDESRDLRVAIDRWKCGEISLGAALRPYVSRHVFATLTADDPRPTTYRWTAGARRLAPGRR